eukprot:TRINITY_DN7484_c0_g1_i2.p1 TRINITY_DN7484_c0_g1~~TRINITY_DN7484_c0_g1_i2.p1  ORF type:complete len:456 (-),score=56.79 TRINITY_DN7484_c0_g1_i2:525-1892(-)
MDCSLLKSLPVLLLFVSLTFRVSDGKAFHMDIYHKFSDEVRDWVSFNFGLDTRDWPLKNSPEYYQLLHSRDHARHTRNLATYDSLAFYSGNATAKIPDLGFLYYTFVEVGTPNSTLLVALDTGSDLFWVPCDCKDCTYSASGYLSVESETIQTYNPSMSKTSQPVTCESKLCELPQACSSSKEQCPYHVAYASANTSSSGQLVQDVLYLTPNDESQAGKKVKANITFGCGMVQTGQFVDGAAPYGLLGLGMKPISVPSTLSRAGIARDSFSICFPSNSTLGRFSFGERGDLDQKETPFVNQNRLGYFINVQEFHVGNVTVPMEFQALFDTGTSFTFLASPIYKSLTSNYCYQSTDPTLPSEYDETLPFKFCFQISDDESLNQAHKIVFNVGEGQNFSILYPLVVLYDKSNNIFGYCLAVFESDSPTHSVFGQNFMTGYQIIFDREKNRLGWKEAK